jgi:hypothetical protein
MKEAAATNKPPEALKQSATSPRAGEKLGGFSPRRFSMRGRRFPYNLSRAIVGIHIFGAERFFR